MERDKAEASGAERNSDIRILLLMAGAFTFSYSLGVFVHEVGHVLGYRYYGIATGTFVFDPLGRSYMYPVTEYPAADLLVGASGSLFNVLCASLALLLVWKRQNLFLLPILMWGATAFIQESIAIQLDVMNGLPLDWAHVVENGVPVIAIHLLSAVFLAVGCSIFIRLLSLVGLRPEDSFWRIVTIGMGAICPFFILSLIYVGFFLGSEMDYLVASKSISLAASIILSVFIAFLFKPTFSSLQAIAPVSSGSVTWAHVGFAVLLALSLSTFGNDFNF